MYGRGGGRGGSLHYYFLCKRMKKKLIPEKVSRLTARKETNGGRKESMPAPPTPIKGFRREKDPKLVCPKIPARILKRDTGSGESTGKDRKKTSQQREGDLIIVGPLNEGAREDGKVCPKVTCYTGRDT